MSLDEFMLPGHRLNKRKFWDYVKLSLYWGYNFAAELVDKKHIPVKRKPAKSN